MLKRELLEAVVDFVPHGVGGDGAELGGWKFDGEIELGAWVLIADSVEGKIDCRWVLERGGRFGYRGPSLRSG
jgi:hypothetical protein